MLTLKTVLGRGDRAGPLKDYCIGLLMPGERKSVEPMAAIVAPARVSAKHQSLLHLVSQAAWSDEAVLAKVRELVLPTIEAQGVDCRRHGLREERRSFGGRRPAVLRAARQDEARRKKARVPDDVTFRTKPEIALATLRMVPTARSAPASRPAVWPMRAVDAERLASRRRTAAAQTVERAGPPARRRACAVMRTCPCFRQDAGEEAWRIVPWREGSNEILSSRFAAVRIRPASRDWKVSTPHLLEWLLIEWPKGEKEPTK
jgi:SRSO17 transposase